MVVVDPAGAPSWQLTGTLQQRADQLGVQATHLSISHDGGLATAIRLTREAAQAWASVIDEPAAAEATDVDTIDAR